MENQKTQTEQLRFPVDIGNCLTLSIILSHVRESYVFLQCRILTWGPFNHSKALEITRNRADISPENGGPTTVAAIVAHEDGMVKFSVAGKTVSETNVRIVNNGAGTSKLDDILQKLSECHIFCNGICKDEFRRVCSGIRYQTKSLIERTYPRSCLVSQKCQLWYKRTGATKTDKEDVLNGTNRCSSCNTAYRNVRKANKRNLQVLLNDELKNKRLTHNSTYPITLLSPKSKKIRLGNQRKHKKHINRELQKHRSKIEEMTVELSDEQSGELSDFVENINEVQLEEVLGEVKETSGQDAAHAIKEAFLRDQERNSKYINLI